MAQTKTQIRALLDAAGIRPQKRFGQNFLIDGNLMAKIPEAAGIVSDDVVLEVGCGTGGLTDLLLARARHVVGVEIDRGLAGCLQQRFAGTANLTLLHTDVLANKSTVADAVLDALRAALATDHSPLLVANLPYNIATPLLVNLLVCGLRFKRYCVCVQREVAERMTATAGREYGPVSVALQACGTIRRVMALPRQAFWPTPQVESAVVRADLHFEPFPEPGHLERFIALVRLGFAHRRKTLRYNLRQTWPAETVARALAAVGLDEQARAEAVGVQEWLALDTALGGSEPPEQALE